MNYIIIKVIIDSVFLIYDTCPVWISLSLYFCVLSEVIVRVAGRSQIWDKVLAEQCHNFPWSPGLQSHTSCSLTSLRVIQVQGVKIQIKNQHTGLVKKHDLNEKNSSWTTRASLMFCQYFNTFLSYCEAHVWTKEQPEFCLPLQWSRTRLGGIKQ